MTEIVRQKILQQTPVVVAFEPVGAKFPIEMAEVDAASTDDDLTRHELPVRHGVRRQVRKVPIGKRFCSIVRSLAQQAKARAPMVAELFDPAPPFGEDHVGGDVSEQKGGGVAAKNPCDAGRQQTQLVENHTTQADVGGRSPRPNRFGDHAAEDEDQANCRETYPHRSLDLSSRGTAPGDRLTSSYGRPRGPVLDTE